LAAAPADWMFAEDQRAILNNASCVCLEADKDDDFSLAQLAAAELPSNHESRFTKASAITCACIALVLELAARCCWLHPSPEGSTIFSNCSAQSTKLNSQGFHIS
jgi:hypothetical protein